MVTVRVKSTFLMKQGDIIYSCKGGEFVHGHKLIPIFAKTVSNSAPQIAGYKVPSWGVTLTCENFLTEHPGKVVVNREILPSNFPNIEGKIFSRLNDKDLVGLFKAENNFILNK